MLKSSLSERDNPFRPGGTLDRESLEMIRSSTFSRSEVIIKDPAASRANSIIESTYLLDDGHVKPHKAVLVHFQSPIKSSPHVAPRRQCSNDSDDDDDDDDDEEEEEENANGFFKPSLDNNNHHVDEKCRAKCSGGSPVPRLNGKATRARQEDEVRADTLTGSGGSVVSADTAQLEHVRLVKRRKCCHVM